MNDSVVVRVLTKCSLRLFVGLYVALRTVIILLKLKHRNIRNCQSSSFGMMTEECE